MAALRKRCGVWEQFAHQEQYLPILQQLSSPNVIWKMLKHCFGDEEQSWWTRNAGPVLPM